MFYKFKKKQIVIVNGKGKCDGLVYTDKLGIVICTDPFFKDYNIRFEDGTEDWLDAKNLKRVKGENDESK